MNLKDVNLYKLKRICKYSFWIFVSILLFLSFIVFIDRDSSIIITKIVMIVTSLWLIDEAVLISLIRFLEEEKEE